MQPQKKSDMIPLESRMILPEKHIFTLNLDGIKDALENAPQRQMGNKNSSVIKNSKRKRFFRKIQSI